MFDSLLDHSVHSIVEWAVGGIIALGTAVLTRALVWRGRVRIGVGEGRTCQSPEVFMVGLLCGTIALACLVWGIVDTSTLEDQGSAVAWLLLIAGFTLGFVATGTYAQHIWMWDAQGLVWRGAWRKTAIRWSDIKPPGKSWDGQFVVRDTHGHAIRWTTYTLEHQALRDAIDAAIAWGPESGRNSIDETGSATA